MKSDNDIVEDIFQRVRKILGENANAEITVRLEKEEANVRHEWGGADAYIAKTRSKNRLKVELSRGTAIKDMPDRLGISRSTVYRLLKKRD